MKPGIRAMVCKAAIATGPLTNSHKVQAFMKERWPDYVPGIKTIAYYLANFGIARPTGRRLSTDPVKGSTVAEYEIVDAGVMD